jgi:hypothetical protein
VLGSALVLKGLATFPVVGNQEVIVGLAPQHPERVLTFRKLRYCKDFFLLFPFSMFLIYMRGVLAECSPGSLVDLIQPGNPPGVVDGRGTTRRTRR